VWSWAGKKVEYTGRAGYLEQLEFSYPAESGPVYVLSASGTTSYSLSQSSDMDFIVVSGPGCVSCMGPGEVANTYYPNGALKLSVDHQGNKTEYGEPDSLGRPPYVRFINSGNYIVRQLEYEYVPANAPATQITVREKSLLDPLADKVAVVNFNGLGYITSVTATGLTNHGSGPVQETHQHIIHVQRRRKARLSRTGRAQTLAT